MFDGFIIFAKNRKIFWLPGSSSSVEVHVMTWELHDFLVYLITL